MGIRTTIPSSKDGREQPPERWQPTNVPPRSGSCAQAVVRKARIPPCQNGGRESTSGLPESGQRHQFVALLSGNIVGLRCVDPCRGNRHIRPRHNDADEQTYTGELRRVEKPESPQVPSELQHKALLCHGTPENVMAVRSFVLIRDRLSIKMTSPWWFNFHRCQRCTLYMVWQTLLCDRGHRVEGAAVEDGFVHTLDLKTQSRQ